MLTATTINHVNNSKPTTNDESASKQGFNFLWRGICGHIKIFGAKSKQQIAYSTANNIGFITRVLQGPNHIQCTLVDQRWVDAMDCWRNFNAFAKINGTSAGLRLTQYFLYEFFNHEKSSSVRQPRSVASWRNRASGLVATGICAFSSKGKSLTESE